MPTQQTENSDLARFLSALWPDLDGRWCLFWGAPSKRSSWVSDVGADELAAIDIWAAKENVYIGCGLRGANLGPTLRGEKADVVAIPGVWLDIDYGAEHKKPNLPPTEAEALQLIGDMGLSPSAVIHSGRGLQAWWLFREPWIFEGEQDRADAEALTKGWCSTLRAKAKAKGWDADQVGDITRVMRLPGTWNRKGVPKRTKLLSLTDARYNPSDFKDYLTAEPDGDKPAAASLEWTFDLNAAAEPPAEKFLLLCEVDTTFRLSWQHARKDLQDQSASSYDMSLATRALAAGWTAQEVVNLLVAHRRKHGEDLKLRKDYYERTLNMAMAGKGVEERRQMVSGMEQGEALPETVAKDPAEILAIISERLGISITKLVRFRSETNTYELEINGKKVNAGGIENFDSQTRFRRIVFDHTDHRIVQFKEEAWHHILQHLFRAVENVDVEIGTNKGAMENWLEMYLSEGVEPEDQWEKAAFNYRPFKFKGEVHIVAEGFRRFLLGQMQERITAQELTMQLTKLGYEYERKNVKTNRGGRTKRSIWKVHA